MLPDLDTVTSLYRYVRRCWFEPERLGALEGGRDSVKWVMLHHIAVTSRRNRRRYRAEFDSWTLPKVALPTRAALARFYATEELVR